ncbi:NADH-quinone oxidoreductase subunit NuoK [Ornithinimicrobium avium]|uniref:NADH-quinone oxidoreductase subunit K n=1 Tax=Ornithinimicrobium avium TaxID=2283195 RepID=A0A345NR49_9MICO|nr:NADH-quinone oxidoreductase subunit NuoK [Ornithinimicrobium avium]AXH97507.1 NADH-quinone oxidoreductase subunit NuoK [Ornithinimicrobium avium]
MIRPALPYLLVAVLAGLGVYGILARRHAILMLIGVELLLAAAGLLLVTVGQTTPAADQAAATSGQVLTLFVITIAAAEVVLALALVLALYRARGHVDLHADLDPRGEEAAR